MQIDKLKEAIKAAIDKVLSENAPAPSKPSPGPAVAPGKPDTGKPKPRRPLGNPDVKPGPKAMNEEEMLQKIVARFKSKNKEELEEKKELKNLGIGIALFITSIAGILKLSTEVKDALDAGKKVEVRFEKDFFDNDKNPTYIVKVDPNQSQEVKVDTATNTVIFNTSDLSKSDILRKANSAIQKIDPNLVASYDGGKRDNRSYVRIKD